MQGDKELEGWKKSPLRLSLQGPVGSRRSELREAPRRYSAPCMLQESPSLQIVLMCLVERRFPENGRGLGPWNDLAQGGGGRRVEGDGWR